MAKLSRLGGVTLWAWVVSLCLHITILSGLAVIRFSDEKACEIIKPAPKAQLARLKRFLESRPVVPKPRIKTAGAENLPVAGEKFVSAVLQAGERNIGVLSRTSGNSVGQGLPAGELVADKAEFAGGFSPVRKVCFVVDCSGSMQGIFSEVLEWLKQSIAGMQPDQYFYIIFFGNEKLYESGMGRLTRASCKAKSEAYDFVKSIRPMGRTNAVAALKRAMQITDATGNSPEIIYFLTDGFEFANEEAEGFLRSIAALRAALAPRTGIDTISFWPGRKDFEILEAIARQNDGEAIRIGH